MFVVLGATAILGQPSLRPCSTRSSRCESSSARPRKRRRGRRRGAEIAVASLDDVPAMINAFSGATGVYLLVPPNYGASAWLAEQRQRMDRAAEVVKKSG